MPVKICDDCGEYGEDCVCKLGRLTAENTALRSEVADEQARVSEVLGRLIAAETEAATLKVKLGWFNAYMPANAPDDLRAYMAEHDALKARLESMTLAAGFLADESLLSDAHAEAAEAQVTAKDADIARLWEGIQACENDGGCRAWKLRPQLAEPCFRDAAGWCSTHTRQSDECAPPPAEEKPSSRPCEGHYNGKGPCFECGWPR